MRHEKRGIATPYLLLTAFLMPYCPVTVVQIYINPRRACAARVKVVVLCVCVCVVSECFRGPHLQPTQLSDKVGILAVLVSCSLVFKKGVFRIMASFRR